MTTRTCTTQQPPSSTTAVPTAAVVGASETQVSPATGVSSSGGRADVEPPPVPSPHPAAAPTLPATGFGGLVLPAGGALLILAGTGCVGLARRKGRRP